MNKSTTHQRATPTRLIHDSPIRQFYATFAENTLRQQPFSEPICEFIQARSLSNVSIATRHSIKVVSFLLYFVPSYAHVSKNALIESNIHYNSLEIRQSHMVYLLNTFRMSFRFDESACTITWEKTKREHFSHVHIMFPGIPSKKWAGRSRAKAAFRWRHVAAPPENNNGTHLFNETLLNPSNRENQDEPIFGGPFSQLSAGRIAALNSEGHISALNNMCMRSFFSSLNFHPNLCSHASAETISANENERPLVSDFISLT